MHLLNWYSNLVAVGGSVIALGQGTKSVSLPVTIASDQGNLGVNVAQINGVTTSAGNGTTDTGTQRVTISSDSTGQVIARGDVASGSSDSGNPVKIGGIANNAAPSAVTASQRVNGWFGLVGQQATFIVGGGGGSPGIVVTQTSGDAQAGQVGLCVDAMPQMWNGATWDRQRSNVEVTLRVSSATTTTNNSGDQTGYNARRLLLVVDVSSAGTGSMTPSLQVKDSVSGNYKTVWTAATALTGNGTYVYYFADGAPNTQPAACSFTEALPYGLPCRTFRVVYTHNNANSMTYSSSGVLGV